MQKPSNCLSVFSKRKVLSVLLTIFSAYNYPARAQIKRLTESNLGPGMEENSHQDDWIFFPCTIQISPYLGDTYNKLTRSLATDNTQTAQQWSGIKGVSIDVGVLQIRRLIYKYFHSYPELGIAFNYGSLENKGSLIGGQIYLKPQHDYLARWEIFPRIGIGVSYATIPKSGFEKLTNDKQNDQQASFSKGPVQDHQQDLHWDLSLALVTRISVDSNWQLSPSIGFNYLPLVRKLQQGQQDSQETIVPTSFTTSVTFGYTPNPGLIRYPSWAHNKHNRIDIGWLSTVKKPSLFTHPPIQEDERENMESEQSEDEKEDLGDRYYYVGGIYGQWSLNVYNNHAFTLATEWVLDRAAEQMLKNNLLASPLKISLLGGHEFRWGSFLFGQQLGFYITNNETLPFALGGWDFYTRIGLDYKLTDFLIIGTNVKTNVLIRFKEKYSVSLNTDFIGFRISYSF